MNLEWTPSQVDQLKAHWAAGLPASAISLDLGVSRNAVIGKANRLKLEARTTAPVQIAPNPPSKTPKKHSKTVTTLLPFVSTYRLNVEPYVPVGQRRTLLELTEDTCHWPIGDPSTSDDFFFCGGWVKSGSYCKHHKHVAYHR